MRTGSFARQLATVATSTGLGAALFVSGAVGADPAAQAPAKTLAFTRSATNKSEFVFDTGAVRGKLRAEGKSQGLTQVYESTTGRRLDRSMGLGSHYRVFTSNHRYGTAAWDWPSEAVLNADGTVQVTWAATKDRPFELRAQYRWARPNALDIETTVLAKTNLTKFESFLASYFSPDFTNSTVWIRGYSERPPGPQFLDAHDGLGEWLAYPRDKEAASIIQDGRWALEPNPVKWTIVPTFARPLGVRRAPGLGITAAIMAPPTDCFAVLTPHQTEGHYSMYLSLFGKDLAAGENARARSRILIEPNLTLREAARACDSYLMDLPSK